MHRATLALCVALVVSSGCGKAIGRAPAAPASAARYDELANLPFTAGFLPKEGIAALKDEIVFQRAVHSYLWALPVLNMYGMKEGSAARGAGQGDATDAHLSARQA
jgi:hypothetical protein